MNLRVQCNAAKKDRVSCAEDEERWVCAFKAMHQKVRSWNTQSEVFECPYKTKAEDYPPQTAVLRSSHVNNHDNIDKAKSEFIIIAGKYGLRCPEVSKLRNGARAISS
ncbi:hypothetical protein NPIL_431491 [Nephila pilipes]|uniref:Uncharacterized protein n=1 Tax=Nephila pilipes TaxID=299642 RepID=A0A8X6NXK7_NEPPI|nr:hypothetical protein NPIL_431491 [Nephila pilipes]